MEEDIIYKFAIQSHLNSLDKIDPLITLNVIKKKISNNQIIVAQAENEILGYLRFGYFWDTIPFMNLLFVTPKNRKKGIGKNLILYWEKQMKAKNHHLIMTSTQSDEEAQHFYRKFGYIDSGSLLLPKEPLEIIFIKNI